MKIRKEQGITLVALIITIIILIILAAVTIKAAFDSNFIGIATKGTEDYAGEQVNEVKELDETAELLKETVSNIESAVANGAGGTTGEKPEETEKPETIPLQPGWDGEKVYAAKSTDGVTVPVPKDFTVSDKKGEDTVSGGLVIKYGANEFVWVPVDKDTFGELYTFSGTTATKITQSSSGNHEPDVLTDTNYGDASTTSGMGIEQLKNVVGITGANNAEVLKNWKTQLEKEYNDMKTSVTTYGGFYIGRYETGNLSQNKAVVTAGNTDISNQNWYVMYQKSKTIAPGSSMIWGCQWDAVLKWFLTDDNTKNYVTNSVGGNYEGSRQPTGYHSVKNIYDMAGNVYEWTLEATNASYRDLRRGQLQQ